MLTPTDLRGMYAIIATPARDGADQVPGATDTSSVKSNGTGPASRQLRDKAGGVTPASLSPGLAAPGR